MIWTSLRGSVYVQYDKPHPMEGAEVFARVKRLGDTDGTLAHMYFTVCLQDRMIGYIACDQRAEGQEIGYSFHADSHGKGYAKESLLALTEYLRGLGIRKLQADAALANVPSIALLKPVGFQLVGQEWVPFYRDAEGTLIVFAGGILECTLAD